MTAATAAAHQASIREDTKAFILGYLKGGEKETADPDGMTKAQGISKGTLERAKTELEKDG